MQEQLCVNLNIALGGNYVPGLKTKDSSPFTSPECEQVFFKAGAVKMFKHSTVSDCERVTATKLSVPECS